jgi:1-acyl-sn-glycerol-3-phosphate acyltransferase
MPGAVVLARETGAPLVPMAIWGPQRILTAERPLDLHRGRPVSLLVGAPLSVHPGTDLREGTARLGARLQAMVDVLQRRPVHLPSRGEHAPWHPAHLGGAAPAAAHARALESVPLSAISPSWLPGG